MLRKHQDQLEEMPVIVITALGGSGAAIEAMKLGAYDYITKPFDLDEVLFTVRRALTQKALVAQVQALATVQLGDDGRLGRGRAWSAAPRPMLQVFKTIGRVAATQEPVLILGRERHRQGTRGQRHPPELGSGKPAHSSRSTAPLSARRCWRANCSAMKRGRSPGPSPGEWAGSSRRNGGTLFLDEIGDLDIDLQAKLAAGIADGPVRARRRQRDAASRCAGHRRHQPQPVGPDRRAAIPGRPVLPLERGAGSNCRRCEPGPRTSRCWPSISSAAWPENTHWPQLALPPKPCEYSVQPTLARQCPRDAERVGSRGDPGAGSHDSGGRPCARLSCQRLRRLADSPHDIPCPSKILWRKRSGERSSMPLNKRAGIGRKRPACWESAAANSSTKSSSTACKSEGSSWAEIPRPWASNERQAAPAVGNRPKMIRAGKDFASGGELRSERSRRHQVP